MPLLLRLIAVLLVLTTSGVARAAVLAVEAVDVCADDEGGEDCCDDCTTACDNCLQCPLQASQVVVTHPAVAEVVAPPETVLDRADASPGTASTADIFHPPRQ